MQIELSINRQGATRRFCKRDGPVTIGRTIGQVSVDVDLGDDLAVSRLHARIWREQGEFWIEDAGSTRGTWVNNEDIKGQGARRLGFDTAVRIGDTTIRLARAEGTTRSTTDADLSECLDSTPSDVSNPAALPSDQAGEESALSGAVESAPFDKPNTEHKALDAASGVTFVERLDAEGSGVVEGAARSSALERQLDLLCELALTLGAESEVRHLLQLAVEQTLRIIPGATRGALLMVERGSGRLMLKAQMPPEYRPSERLARQAMEQRAGFAWVRSEISELSDFSDVGNGMSVPLIAGGQSVGALCVDAPPSRAPFGEAELRILRAIGQFVSMAVEQHNARTLLARQADFTNRLFCSRFPEKVRNALLVDAAEGSLPIGTRRSMVTVLQSDIRGFTRLSEELGPQRLSDLLNAYFPALIDAVFAFGGTVERLVGDAIFAVFGTPEPDHEQQEHAVRAALAMQQAVLDVSAFREKRRQPTCGIGIGIDCGEVLHGFIGNADSIDFTVIGDPANYSSRYCSGAKAGEILMSPNVRSHVWKQVDSELRMILSKHEGEIEAHLVKTMRVRA